MDNKIVLGAGRKFSAPVVQGAEATGAPEKLVAQVKATPASKHKYLTSEIMTLVGVTHSKYPFAELELAQDVQLVFDPYGKVVKPKEGHPDPTAISVQDMEGKHIGYLKAAVAKVVTKALASKQYLCRANVNALKGGREGLNWGVDVEVKFFSTGEGHADHN